MFAWEFGRATMVCQIENIFQDGDWAILEWADPKWLSGCGFFNILNDKYHNFKDVKFYLLG